MPALVTFIAGIFKLHNDPVSAIPLFIITAILLVIVLIFAFGFIFRFPYYKGVFAVSAIILNDKHELLLMNGKKDSCWKQPGGFYRTNSFSWRKELETPYDFIKRKIKEETDIDSSVLIDIPTKEYAGQNLQELIKDKYYIGEYGNNIPSPPPLFIMKETRMSGKKIRASHESFHIDFYYAFTISTHISLSENNRFMSIEQIKSYNGKIYRDLAFVGQTIMDKYILS